MTNFDNLTKSHILADNGWDKGFVYFGHPATETTVKVVTAIMLISHQDNFPYGNTDLKHVMLSFDDKPLEKDDNGAVSMGIDSPEWQCLSDKKSYMPAICIEGELYFESADIVKMLNDKYPDTTLSDAEAKEVAKWIAFNQKHTARMMVALKHFGWCFMQGSRPNYIAYGKDNKDEAWEKDIVKDVHAFFQVLEEHFTDKTDPTYYVGNKLTMADCAMINWPWSFYLVVQLKIEERYPHVWKHFEALKAKAIEGSDQHYNVFPFFTNVVADLGKEARENGFHIENEKYWV